MLPLWAGIAALVGWGMWQAAEFRRSLNDEPGASPASATTAAAAAPTIVNDAPPGIDRNDGGEPEQMFNASLRVTPDEWAAATTPAALDQVNEAAPVPVGVVEPAVAASAPAEQSSVTADELMARGAQLLDAGHIVEGRASLNAALAVLGEDPRSEHLRQELTSLNADIFLGSTVVAEDPAANYVDIQPGDSFLKLGRRYGIPPALVEAINPGLNPRNLKPATGVKIVQGPFHLRIFKHAGRIDLYARDLYVQSFAGSVEEGNYLPVGTYRVSSGSKIQVGQKVWVGIEGASEGAREVVNGWLYGQAGPRQAKRSDLISGIKLADADLVQLYNVLVEGRSLVRVEP